MRADETDILDWWLDAGLSGGDWTSALDRTAAELGAQPMVLVRFPEETQIPIASVCSNASFELVYRCRELARSGLKGLDQLVADDLGHISWAAGLKDATGTRVRINVFALHPAPFEKEKLRPVLNAVVGAMRTKRRHDTAQAVVVIKAAAYERIPFALAILDDDMRVLDMNAMCQTLLQRKDGLILEAGCLKCVKQSDHVTLSSVIAGATSKLPPALPLVSIARVGRVRPYLARVIMTGGTLETSPKCLLMLMDPEAAASEAEMWRAMLDLTDDELRVARQIIG